MFNYWLECCKLLLLKRYHQKRFNHFLAYAQHQNILHYHFSRTSNMNDEDLLLVPHPSCILVNYFLNKHLWISVHSDNIFLRQHQKTTQSWKFPSPAQRPYVLPIHDLIIFTISFSYSFNIINVVVPFSVYVPEQLIFFSIPASAAKTAVVKPSGNQHFEQVKM